MNRFVSQLRAALARVRGTSGTQRADREMHDEFASHVRLAADEHIRRGMTPGDAHRQAMIDSGGLANAAELVRERRGMPLVESIIADIRYSARGLLRAPVYTAVATVTLALGIGANTAIFSVVNGVLFKSLPYAQGDRLLSLSSDRSGRAMAVSVPDFVDWRQQTRAFDGIVAAAASTTVLTHAGEPVQLSQARVTANAFDVLGLPPVLGRAFADGEDEPSAPRVAMLSEQLWRSRFGSDSAIIGRTLTFDGFPTTIIGIASSAMTWPDAVDVWMTTRFSSNDRAPGSRGARWLEVVGRLKPGVTTAGARADVQRIARSLAVQDPKHNADVTAVVTPLLAQMVANVRRPLYLLLGAVGLVLLIACANVASLTTARAMSRDAEFAIRTALGAGRSRIVRQILTDSVLLAFVGGTLGVLLGLMGVRALIAMAPSDIPRLYDIALDRRVLAFATLITTATGVLFGLVPALQGSSAALHARLRVAGRSGEGRAARARTRRVLVTGEVALAIVLLCGAGLLVRSFALLRAVDPGFRAEHVVTFNVSLPGTAKYDAFGQLRAFNTALLDGLSRVPGVTSAAATFGLPLSGDNMGFTFSVAGAREYTPEDEPRAQARVATPEYFATMGIPVLRGRVFDHTDRGDTRPVMVISSEVARLYFRNDDPIGKVIQTGWGIAGRKYGGEVIGVVGDVHQLGLEKGSAPHMYMSYDQWPLHEFDVVVRSSTASADVFRAVRNELRQLDPEVPMNGPRTLSDLVEASLGQRRFFMRLLTAFAVVAMSLATVGIYGVIAYGVQQRRREIGIRLALGATSRRVVRMIVLDGLSLVAMGVAIGTGVALMLTKVLSAMLYGITSRDPVTLLASCLLLTLVALTACLLPARAAARLDPTETIRAD